MMSMDPSRAYLLDITQHRIGGFSKTVGYPPDIYHSYLGLAYLSLLGRDGFKEFDTGLCCSEELTRKIMLARDGPLSSNEEQGWENDGFWKAMDKSAL